MASRQGIQITIDNSSVWNSDTMLRTELIPQTSAPINKVTWIELFGQTLLTGLGQGILPFLDPALRHQSSITIRRTSSLLL